jgi:hypothetical protein
MFYETNVNNEEFDMGNHVIVKKVEDEGKKVVFDFIPSKDYVKKSGSNGDNNFKSTSFGTNKID